MTGFYSIQCFTIDKYLLFRFHEQICDTIHTVHTIFALIYLEPWLTRYKCGNGLLGGSSYPEGYIRGEF